MNLMQTITSTNTKVQINPFVGLRSFETNESHLYFGRDKQINEAKEKLLKNRFLGIVGASGLGKSSFVYCGLLNTLINENPDMWELCVARPDINPIGNLLKSIFKKNIPESEYASYTPQKLVEEIKNLQAFDGKRYLIYLDQFEEIFTFAKEDAVANQQAKQYVEMFIEAFSQNETPIYVILTMRSEFIGNCAQYPNLTEKLNESQFLIPQMTREEKREAIVKPIALMGASIDDNLVNKILIDAGDSADQLPVMQHALMRTWAQWKKNRFSADQTISAADYEAVGGMQKALSVHANEVYSQLNETERKICEKIFKTITEKGSEGAGVRKPALLSQIASIADYPINEVATVVNHFRKEGNGLLMPSPDKPLTEDTLVDISHESLMRIWTSLSQWVDDESSSVKLYLRLAEASEAHQSGQPLWVPPDLQVAQKWREEQKPSLPWGMRHNPMYERAMFFLDSSQKQYDQLQTNKEKLQKRRLANARKISIGSIIVVIICLLFLLYALQQGEQAKKASIAAEAQAVKAQKATVFAEGKQKEAAKSAAEATVAKNDALVKEEEALVASKAALKAKAAADISAIAALQAQASAQNEKAIAIKQMEIANINKQVADINNKLAEIQKQKALLAQENVRRLEMVSIAKAMAIKASKLPDSDLQTLVAQQANFINLQHRGKPNDPDIYQGLYYAVKTLKGKQVPNFNQFTGHKSNVRCLVPMGNSVISTGSDGMILSWGTQNMSYYDAYKVVPNPIKSTESTLNRTLAFNQNGTQMACAGEYPFIQVFENNVSKVKLPIKAKEIWFLAFLPSGELISVDSNKQMLLWNLNSATPDYKELLKSDIKVNAIAAHPTLNQFAIGKNNGEIEIYDNKGTKLNSWKDMANGAITALVYSSNGTKLASGAESGMLKIWESATGGLDEEQKEHRARISSLAFSRTGEQLASASFDRTVRIWNSSNLNEIPIVLDDHQDWVWSITFSPDGQKLLAGCKDNMIRVWATQSKDMQDVVCKELAAQSKRTELKLTKNEWEKYVKKLEANQEIPCTCCTK